MTNRDRLLTSSEAADALRVTAYTLGEWRKHGKGPPFHRVGGQFRYYESDLHDWVRDQQERDHA